MLAISGGKLLAGRDILGLKPLYYGRDWSGAVAFASLKAGLSRIGIRDPRAVPPGHLVAVSNKQMTVLAKESLSSSKELEVSEDEATARVGHLLLESLAEDVPEGYVTAFSGGLDSTLVAYAAKENELGPELITVGLKGQEELEHAREVAEEMGMGHLLVGQLSDELFAGYGRFEELALKHHFLEAKKEVLRSVLAA